MNSSIIYKLFAILAIIYSAIAAPVTIENGNTITYKR